MLCRHKESPVYFQLLRRDVTALCAAEHDSRRALVSDVLLIEIQSPTDSCNKDDETDSTSKVLNQRLRVMRAAKEPERIMQTSKLLEAENLRLAGAAKSKVSGTVVVLSSFPIDFCRLKGRSACAASGDRFCQGGEADGSGAGRTGSTLCAARGQAGKGGDWLLICLIPCPVDTLHRTESRGSRDSTRAGRAQS
jgi:hypothetical protein